MAVPLMTWRQSAVYVVTATLAGFLQGLKDAIDAEVAANPTTALWQVADFSAVNGTLTMKSTAVGITAGGSSTRRLMLFGGSAPNTNAIDAATSNATYLYCGCAPTANVDAPQQAYTAGAPYTTGAWVAGGAVSAGTYTSATRVQYWETFAGVFVGWRFATMNATLTQMTAFMGGLGVTLDGNTEVNLAAGSVGFLAADQDTAAATAAIITPRTVVSLAANPRLNYYDVAGLAVLRAYRCMVPSVTNNAAFRGAGNERYFVPYILREDINTYTRIKLRQIGLGTREVHGTIVSDVSGVQAYKIGERTDVVTDGPWLVNQVV